MAEIVLRVRLVGGDHIDVRYDDPDRAEDTLMDHVIATLADDCGVLRARPGGRPLGLCGRGVATREVAPRGAVL